MIDITRIKTWHPSGPGGDTLTNTVSMTAEDWEKVKVAIRECESQVLNLSALNGELAQILGIAREEATTLRRVVDRLETKGMKYKVGQSVIITRDCRLLGREAEVLEVHPAKSTPYLVMVPRVDSGIWFQEDELSNK